MWLQGGLLFITLTGTLYAEDGLSRRQAQAKLQALNGCFHAGRYYFERSLIPTVDSCINCKCEGGLVRCNMTLCPLYPTIQDGCHLSHEEGLCCPQLTCDETVAKKLANVPTILEATLLGCTYNDVEYGLGDFIPTSDPCQACYCIHNRTQCVHQNCALPESAREGCRPVFHHGVCCPMRYDCSEALAAPPTQKPPFVTEGCAVNNRLYDEGEAIPSGRSCEHCYCMKGEMICAMQKCDSPMAGCIPILKSGQCCPERYECPNGESNTVAPGDFSKTIPKNLLSMNVSFSGSNYALTTRTLEDDADLGEFQHTTGPSVIVTSPLSQQSRAPPSLNQLNSGLPTVFPTQAQIGFGEPLKNSSSSGRNFTINKAVSDESGGGSSLYNGGIHFGPKNSSMQKWDQTKPTDVSPEDLLSYNVLQTKVGSVYPTAAEFLNSGDPLGKRNPNTPTAAANDVASPTVPTSGPGDVGMNGNRHTDAYTGANEHIRLNTKLNVTAASPTVAVTIMHKGSSNILKAAQDPSHMPTPAGNYTRRPVLPAPLDPTIADPIEGLIHFFDNNQPSLLAFGAGSSQNSSIIFNPLVPPNQGTNALNNQLNGQNMVVQVPSYSHLTEVGVAPSSVVDPSDSDEIEGQLSTRREISHSSLKNSGSSGLIKSQYSYPVDPTAANQIEGISSQPSVENLLDFSTPVSLKSADPRLPKNESVGHPTNPSKKIGRPQDPTSVAEVEGALTPGMKTKNTGSARIPVDPSVETPVEGAATIFSETGEVKVGPVDPSAETPVEGAVKQSSSGINGEKVQAVDPSAETPVEGAVKQSSSGINGEKVQAVDPSAETPVEGAIDSMKPLDPQASEVEGALIMHGRRPVNLTMIKSGLQTGNTGVIDPTQAEAEGSVLSPGKNANQGIKVKAGAVEPPVDPKDGWDIEGGLVGVRPSISKGNQTNHQPVDPTSSDKLEGPHFVIPATELQPVDPTSADKLEGPGSVTLHRQRDKVFTLGTSLPVEPSEQDNIEGIWMIPHDSKNQDVSKSTTMKSREPQIIASTPRNPTSRTQHVLGGAVISEKKVIIGTKPAKTVSPAASTIPSGTSLISVRLNGSIPAQLMLALNSAKASGKPLMVENTQGDHPSVMLPARFSSVNINKGWGGSGLSLTTAENQGWGASPNQGWGSSGNKASDSSNLRGNSSVRNNTTLAASQPERIPGAVDPTADDTFEGQIQIVGAGVSGGLTTKRVPVLPLEPIPTDEYEGMDRPNLHSSRQQSTKKNLPLSGSIVATVSLADSSSPSTMISSPLPIAKTTTGLPARFSTRKPVLPDKAVIGTASMQATTPVAITAEPLEGASHINSVLAPLDLAGEGQQLNSSRGVVSSTSSYITRSRQQPGGYYQSSLDEGSVFNGTLAIGSDLPTGGAPLTGIYENGCFFEGNYYRNYQAISTNDLVDPCLVRLCKDGVIFGPSEQRCPPPIPGCFSTSIPGVCCPVYLCPNYLERNETSYTLKAAEGDQLNTEKTRLALAKFCRVGPRFLALNERVVHVMGIQCQTCTCKQRGIVCEPGCAQGILITTLAPNVQSPRRFETIPTSPPTTTPSTPAPVTEPMGSRSCVIQKKKFHHGDEVTFNDPCHICTCLDGLVICKMNRKACRSAKLLSAMDPFL